MQSLCFKASVGARCRSVDVHLLSHFYIVCGSESHERVFWLFSLIIWFRLKVTNQSKKIQMGPGRRGEVITHASNNTASQNRTLHELNHWVAYIRVARFTELLKFYTTQKKEKLRFPSLERVLSFRFILMEILTPSLAVLLFSSTLCQPLELETSSSFHAPFDVFGVPLAAFMSV